MPERTWSSARLVALGEHRVAEMLFEIGGVDQGAEVLKRSHARFVIGVVGGNLAGENPVDEAPPGQFAEQAVGMLVFGEPGEDVARAGQGVADDLRVGAVHPVVVKHADPEQRERGDVLREGTGIAAARDAFGDAGLVEGLRGLAAEAVVAGDGVGDERLDARVADVLELLVVGRVHVGFVGIEARGAPADFPDLVEIGCAGLELGALLEGVGGEVGLQRFERERFGAGGDVEVEIAPGAPPEGHEDAVLAAVGEEAVGQAESLRGCFTPLSRCSRSIAIALVLVFVVEGFGVGEDDVRAFAAGDGRVRDRRW